MCLFDPILKVLKVLVPFLIICAFDQLNNERSAFILLPMCISSSLVVDTLENFTWCKYLDKLSLFDALMA